MHRTRLGVCVCVYCLCIENILSVHLFSLWHVIMMMSVALCYWRKLRYIDEVNMLYYVMSCHDMLCYVIMLCYVMYTIKDWYSSVVDSASNILGGDFVASRFLGFQIHVLVWLIGPVQSEFFKQYNYHKLRLTLKDHKDFILDLKLSYPPKLWMYFKYKFNFILKHDSQIIIDYWFIFRLNHNQYLCCLVICSKKRWDNTSERYHSSFSSW